MWFRFNNSKDPESIHNLSLYSRISTEQKERYQKDEENRIVSSLPKIQTGNIILHLPDKASNGKTRKVIEYDSWTALQYDLNELQYKLGISAEGESK